MTSRGRKGHHERRPVGTRILGAVARWYRGEARVRVDSSPHLLVLGLDQRRHWTATVTRGAVAFWTREWKWVLGFCVAVAGIALGIRRL
jgi:hypothetical protein